MLAPTSERIDDALARLSADDRALLELSLRRGVADDDIAALLHVHREHVEHRRELALERLAEDLDADSRAEVAALVGQSLRLNGEAAEPVEAPAAAPVPRRLRRRVTDLPPSSAAGGRSRRRTALIAGAALAAAIAALAIALSSGGDDPAPAPAAPAPAPAANGAPVALAPVTPNGRARGSAQLQGSRLRVRISGLPAGSYALWLFDDVSNARMVARFNGPGAALEAKLPADFQAYRFIDVSSEPADGNTNHSGASLLRAPLAKLLGR